MKTFVIAQHHGTFLTLNSMHQCGIDNIVVIIPGSQVEKYNTMYNDNQTNPEFIAFKDYDKAVSNYIKQNNIDAQVFVVDNFDVRNTATSMLKVIDTFEERAIVAIIMSGALAIQDYREDAKMQLSVKHFGMCMSRVYQSHPALSMYHMLGLPREDKSLDINFFVVDMTKITPAQLEGTDSQLLSQAMKRNQVAIIPRSYNGKDDVLIGPAISARQSIAHGLRIENGYIVNLWNKSIKPYNSLTSEEIYSYPLHLYSKYIKDVKQYLPKSTVNKILTNGEESRKATSGLIECLDIIDL